MMDAMETKRWFSWSVAWKAALALLAIALTWPYVFYTTERIELNDETRASLDGEDFIQLSDGWTHYRWNGPIDGPVVVFVHGFSSPMFIWERQAQALGEAGFRVLRFDLYGRGYSDRPDIAYDADLFDRQLLELIDKLGVVGPVDVVGLSMGGPITLRFVDRHPHRVRRFGLIAPADSRNQSVVHASARRPHHPEACG